ncbi:hypothetical protein F5Y12DRAFT_373906 [Xylaria sp. FL1777]|nr:hypothetical protein F5Y12DRAFT_373906 [Xylaria sp. FL1777]
MPGIVAATPAETGYRPSATQKATSSPSQTSSHSSKSDGHNVSQRKQQRPSRTPDEPPKKSQLKLKKPFSKKARRIITKKTKKLIKRRNALDQAVLDAVQKTTPGVNDWLPRDKLLRNRERLEKREQYHLTKRTKKLVELERFYRWDPSSARASDYDLVRKLLWRFKRNLGPLLEEYTNRPDPVKNESDETSSSGLDSDSDSDSKSEWSETSSNKDEKLPRKTMTIKPPSLYAQNPHKQGNSRSHNIATTETSSSAPLGAQVDGGKRKREEESPECTPSKKALDGETCEVKSDQENARKKKKPNKGEKKKEVSVEEPQINGK